MIMAHISVSNHFKRQEKALSDENSGSEGLRMQSTGHVSPQKRRKTFRLFVLLANPCNYAQSRA